MITRSGLLRRPAAAGLVLLMACSLACRRDGAHLGGGRSRPAARPVPGGDANVAAGPGDLFVAGARPGIRGTGDGEEGQEDPDPPSGSP